MHLEDSPHGPKKGQISHRRRPLEYGRTTTRLKLCSSVVTDGAARAPHRAMLRATGLRDDDLKKPLIGVEGAVCL